MICSCLSDIWRLYPAVSLVVLVAVYTLLQRQNAANAWYIQTLANLNAGELLTL